jgi:pimeloyl-ACP methyl ester carboxylesterase
MVRFDARGRGQSGTSADYSLHAAVEEVGRVIEAAGVTRPVLVGWSPGGTTAVRYAAQHPGQVAGLFLIDGGFPIAMFDDKASQAARAQFRRLGLLMRIAAAAGRGARLTPEQAANVVIEMDAVNGELATDFKVWTTRPRSPSAPADIPAILRKCHDLVVAAIKDVAGTA